MSKVRIQDDLYMAENEDWLKDAVIPSDRTSIGSFSSLDINVEKILTQDFEDFSSNKKDIPNPLIKNAVTIYKKAKDFKTRDSLGISPIKSRLEYILNIKDIEDFNNKLTYLYNNLYTLPFKMMVDTNMKDTSSYCVMLQGESVYLPDVSYYDESNTSGNQLIQVFKTMIEKELTFIDFIDNSTKEKIINQALEFDKIISKYVKSQLEWSEYTKTYNPINTKDLISKLPTINLESLLKNVYSKIPDQIILAETKYFDNFSSIFNKDTFELFKSFMFVNELNSSCKFLTSSLREIGSTYMNILTGKTELPKIEKEAFQIASYCYSEPIGIYYGETYFGQKAKDDVTQIVKGLINTYKQRLSKNTWLSESTKEKAILKLDKMELKMGYPSKCQEVYNLIKVDENKSLYEIITDVAITNNKYKNSLLYKKVDRSIWVMPGHMVNACYNPFTNDITFPAAILQEPFYSIKQSRASNLGGIGCVIGHEISHAFDNNGAMCDEEGNLNNWWTDADFETFKEKTKVMIYQFDGLEIAGGKINGELTVSENIADNGGVASSLQTLEQEFENPDYKSFFKQFGRIWGIKMRDEYQQLLLNVDVHSPAYYRANMQVRNFPQWYIAFDVTDKDKMYLPENKRVIIW